jgi:hypothetical protein
MVQHVNAKFAKQFSTHSHSLTHSGMAEGAFRVRCFQSSLAPANAWSDPGKVTGQRWPQPSMPGPFRQVYLDVKGEQSIEQLRLAIKMMLAEPAARKFFAAVLE